MYFRTLIASLALATSVFAGTLTKLEVDRVHIPETCDIKSEKNDMLSMEYTGRLLDGGKHKGRGPFQFPLGAGRVIRGWDEGLIDMCVGEKRQLRIPSDLAYGSRGAGGLIPPNADLVFDVELLEISNKKGRSAEQKPAAAKEDL
ncbi:immunophilin [Clavulina sp. PMI_390]|nr:immunophilin [Clavulina sp. PMI_390]